MPRDLDAIVDIAIAEARRQGLLEGAQDADIRSARDQVRSVFNKLFPSQELQDVRTRTLEQFDAMIALVSNDPFFSNFVKALAPYRQEILSSKSPEYLMKGSIRVAVADALIALPYRKEDYEILNKSLAYVNLSLIPTSSALQSPLGDGNNERFYRPPEGVYWRRWVEDARITKVYSWGCVSENGQILNRAVIETDNIFCVRY